MEIKEKVYFNNLLNYRPRVDKLISPKYLKDINHYSLKIRNTAKDALNEEISSKRAKREISDLLDIVKQLKRGIKIN